MKQQLILVGGGGHCQSVIDIIETAGKYEIIGILDQAHKVGQSVSGYPVVGTDDELASWIRLEICFLITVGQTNQHQTRFALFQKIQRAGGKWATAISPRAYVSPSATLGAGTTIMHDALVNTRARVGENTIINTQALVEHGASVGSHCHVATGAIVNGDCRVGDHVLIGSGAVLLQGTTIAKSAIIGAGAVVTRSLTEPGTYTGVPARKIR